MKFHRSVLYVPGNKPRALEKSRGLAADCVVYDLEDSVGPKDKDVARDLVVRTLSVANISGRERIVRVNSLNSDWVKQDVTAIKQLAVDAVLLPKISSAGDIRDYRRLFGAENRDTLVFWVMAETAAGIMNMQEIAAADPAIQVLMMGLEDLAMETRIRHTPKREGFLLALSTCVMAARAQGLDSIDGVYTALEDEAGFLAECRQAVDLGFDGKSLIHPRQIEICNQSFSPDQAEIRWAEEIVTAWEEQQRLGHSVVVINGRMIEQLHVAEAHRILKLATALTEKV